MADQSHITYSGIGRDPSATRNDTFSDWTVTYADGTIIHDSTTTTMGVTDTSDDGTQYGKELSAKGLNLYSARFDIEDSGHDNVTTCWEWFNPTGQYYDSQKSGGDGSYKGGTWTQMTAPARNPSVFALDPYSSAEWDIIKKATKFRVKVVSASGTDRSSTINAAGFAEVRTTADFTAELNDTVNNPVTIGGIGADPS